MTTKTSYILLNDKLIPVNEPVFRSTNRSFRYGDGLFESIRLINGKLHLFDLHIERMLQGVNFLKIQVPSSWDSKFFHKKVFEILEKNQIKDNARVRLCIFRAEGGFYTPRSLKGEYLIEVEDHPMEDFPLNKKGLKVDIFTDMEKATNVYSNFKTNNGLVYILASIYKKDEGLDDCLLINSQNRVAEAISSNIFVVKEGEIYTPPLSDGCVAGVMRSHILKVMEDNNIKCQESPIALEDLFKADEIFLTDTIKGIRWVGSYKVKRYDLGIAKELSDYLNKSIRP